MTHRNIYTGRKLTLTEQRDGKGYFEDGNSRVICRMMDVTDAAIPLPDLPVYGLAHYQAMIPVRM